MNSGNCKQCNYREEKPQWVRKERMSGEKDKRNKNRMVKDFSQEVTKLDLHLRKRTCCREIQGKRGKSVGAKNIWLIGRTKRKRLIWQHIEVGIDRNSWIIVLYAGLGRRMEVRAEQNRYVDNSQVPDSRNCEAEKCPWLSHELEEGSLTPPEFKMLSPWG